ncbi:hypothetical protein, partial [Streptomyces bohaiensis]|uniref:hypothetical protein n=1 Tax=Streptomyces bohaiensis TaxID=1431344 RepID=UPI0030C67D33
QRGHRRAAAWRHLRAHGVALPLALLAGCAAGWLWWGDRLVVLPHLGGGAGIPVAAAQALPVLVAVVVVLSAEDGMRDFSEHAARSRRGVLARHLAAAAAAGAAVCAVGTLATGTTDQLPVALRNLLLATGLGALCAAPFSPRAGWPLPLLAAAPALTLGSGTPADAASGAAWWEWPTAAATPGSWTQAVLVAAVGAGALLAGTDSRPWWRAPRGRRDRAARGVHG